MTKKSAWIGCLLTAACLLGGCASGVPSAKEQSFITVKDIKEKYNDNNSVEKTVYGIGKYDKLEYEFAYDFSNSDINQGEIVTVHTDEACKEESKVFAYSEIKKTKNGCKVILSPSEETLGNDASRKDKKDNWGSAPIYYVAIHYDQKANKEQKVSTPSITPFTLKSECEVPTLQGKVDEDGRFSLQWNAVSGASGYNVYHYVTGELYTGENNKSIQGAKTGYQDGTMIKEATVKGTSFQDFAGKGAAQAKFKSYKSDLQCVAGQNYCVNGNYYVTAIVNGKESGFSNVVTTAQLAIPYRMDEKKDIMFELYSSPDKMPKTVPVINIDGTVKNRKVLYKFNWGKNMLGQKTPQYIYTVEGTSLTGYVTITGDKDRDFPQQIGEASSSGEYKIQDNIQAVPQSAQTPQNEVSDCGIEGLQENLFVQGDSPEVEWIARNLIAGKTKFYIGDFPKLSNPTRCRELFYKAYYQNPYAIGVYAFQCDFHSMNMEVTYVYSDQEREKIQKEMAAKAKEIVSQKIDDDDSVDKVEAIYQWLSENAKYDYDALKDCKEHHYEKQKESAYEYANNAYGVLVKGTGLCQSYGDAVMILCHEAKVPVNLVTGHMDGSLPHAWNQVEIDGNWYQLDATNNEKTTGVPYYLYLASDRTAEQMQYQKENVLATCSKDDMDYYCKNGLCVTTQEDWKKILQNWTKETILTARLKPNMTVEDTKQCIRQCIAENEMKKIQIRTVGAYLQFRNKA